jgi:D-beta-D-heptose 7-phosphate kinase/D-beta-D-heptose 1-phosphate adenosyltransferase
MDASLIDRLAQATVLVVGDVLLDRFVEGKVGRVSPEAPVAVLNHRGERALLGGAGNVAANLVGYGAKAVLVGVAGDDDAAGELRSLCGGLEGLDCRLVTDPSRPTTVKTRYLSGWHQLLRVDAEDASPLGAPVARELLTVAEAAMAEAGAVVLSDYAKGVLDAATIPALIASARSKGIPVVVDPKKADAAHFAGATLLTPNAEEMGRFAGMAIANDADVEAACRRLLARVDVDAILVTRGERGMTLCRRDAEPLHIPAETHRVFDVTGAGDTVAATLAAALAAGLALPVAVRIANAAAGVVVTKPGTATVSPAELKQALGVAGSANVMAAAEALEQVAAWKRQGLKVGFTNGCFDLLHRGHLHSLDQAARRVDRLVVGLNTDASATRLKGPGRPVQDLDTRAAVLAALRSVDLVVPFDEDTPAGLIETVVPDVLFKGADYAEADVAGGDFVKRNGGRVELLPLLPGHSTTGTVGRLRASGGDASQPGSGDR